MKYELDNIYNEDSYKAIKDIPDNSIDLIIIDPPYEIVAGGFGKGSLADRKGKQKTDMIKKGLYDGFNYEIFGDILRVMKKVNVFVWCSKYQIKPILDYFFSNVEQLRFDILTWHKTNPAPTANMTYLNDTEYCLSFREKGVIISGKYNEKKKYWVTPINKKDKEIFKHMTIKPIKIIKQLIKNSSQPNDIVADFFLGSGTTCVAAKELGRRYIGFEIDKEYYKIAKDRLNGVTANGQTSMFTDFDKLDI